MHEEHDFESGGIAVLRYHPWFLVLRLFSFLPIVAEVDI